MIDRSGHDNLTIFRNMSLYWLVLYVYLPSLLTSCSGAMMNIDGRGVFLVTILLIEKCFWSHIAIIQLSCL